MQGCRIRIVYPDSMTVGSELSYITGSGLFEPLGGTLEFKADYSQNSIDIISC